MASVLNLLLIPGTLAAPSLTGKQLEAVGQAAEAARQGRALIALQLVAPLIDRLDRDDLATVERILKARKTPSLGKLLADARITLIEQGLKRSLPRIGTKETLLILPAIKEQVDAAVKQKADSEAMTAPVPRQPDFQRFETLLRGVHVLDQQFESAVRLSDYAAEIARRFPKRRLNRFAPAERAILEPDYAALADEVRDARRQIDERQAELLLARLEMAVGVLQEKRLTKERFEAAFVFEEDAERVLEFLKQHRTKERPFETEALNEEGLDRAVRERLELGRSLAGDLAQKAKWLYYGLDWWVRGRYGEGPLFWGLAKSPEAMRSPEARWKLWMPAEAPEASNPFKSAAGKRETPRYRRRHYVIWAVDETNPAALRRTEGLSKGSPLDEVGRLEAVRYRKFC
jgi:hypothetical protein